MDYKDVDASECEDLINTKGNKLPLSAANSMNYLASCLEQEDSWVAKHYVLYNIMDAICTWGYDESCTLDWPDANQATCPHGLGTPVALTDAPVYNIQYPTGKKVLAGAPQTGTDTTGSESKASMNQGGIMVAATAGIFITILASCL